MEIFGTQQVQRYNKTQNITFKLYKQYCSLHFIIFTFYRSISNIYFDYYLITTVCLKRYSYKMVIWTVVLTIIPTLWTNTKLNKYQINVKIIDFSDSAIIRWLWLGGMRVCSNNVKKNGRGVYTRTHTPVRPCVYQSLGREAIWSAQNVVFSVLIL